MTAISAVLVNYLFIPPLRAFSGQPQEIAATALFAVAALLIIGTADTLRRTLAELDQVLARETGLRLELTHRVKNNLTIVQGLARQIARTSPDPQAFYEALSDRLSTLGLANNVLSTGKWENCDLPALIKESLRPFQSEGTIAIRGPACLVPPAACVPLVMALHELATNAVKYGALSVPEGRVDVHWRLSAEPDGQRLYLTWQERNGPPVMQPTRRGLGSRLLRPQAGLDDVRLSFEPTGVRCDLELEGAQPIAGAG